MKRILVAVDGSDASVRGARFGLALAGEQGAAVTLAYVVPPMIVPGDAPWAPVTEIHAEEQRRGQRVLDEILSALGRPAADTVVRIGPPAETLADTAAKDGFDLIVVGSSGKGAVKRLLVGSTADRLVHISPRPVLVVH